MQGGQERYYNHREPIFFSPEQIALQALVDEMIRRSDEALFALLNTEVERIRKNERERTATENNL